MLVCRFAVVDFGRLSDGDAVSGDNVKLGTLALLLTLVTAPACGGGGGASSDPGPGNSPTPVSASFVAAQPTPGANTVAMLQAAKSNDVVSVWVTLTNTSNVFGVAFDVVYDDTQVTYLGYTPGVALEAGGGIPNYTVSGSNPGRVVVGIARTNGTSTNIAATRAVITLQFRVKQAGTSEVGLESGVVTNAQQPPTELPGISWYAGALTGV